MRCEKRWSCRGSRCCIACAFFTLSKLHWFFFTEEAGRLPLAPCPASTANEARSNPHLHLSSDTPCHHRPPPPPWNLVKARTAHRSLVHEARVAKRKQERMEGRLQDLRKDLRFAEELNLSLRGNEAQWDQHVRSFDLLLPLIFDGMLCL